jgi:Domain of unknown function (DUF4328)
MAEPEFRDGAWWLRQPDGTLLRWDAAANAWVRPERLWFSRAYQKIANDIWRGSDPDLPRLIGPGYWRGAPIPGLLFGLWWLLWLVTTASLGPGAWSRETVEELRAQSIQYLVSDVTEVGAALLCAAVVGRTTRRQEERARRVEAVAPATATA